MLPTSSTSQEAPHSWYNGFFFPHFYLCQHFGKVLHKVSKISWNYTRKTKISPIYFSKDGEISQKKTLVDTWGKEEIWVQFFWKFDLSILSVLIQVNLPGAQSIAVDHHTSVVCFSISERNFSLGFEPFFSFVW
jgi:hypothetical protein